MIQKQLLSNSILFIILLFMSCNKKDIKNTNNSNCIISNVTSIYKLNNKFVDNDNCYKSARYDIFYIGNKKTEIEFNAKCDLSKFWITKQNKDKYSFPAENQLEISIDTNQKIVNYDGNDGAYNGYAMFIYNLSSDTLKISPGEFLPGYLEGMSVQEVWKPIQDGWRYIDEIGDCLVLPPKYMILTSVPVYEGVFNTKLRFKLYNSFSNEFNGGIDTSIFQRPLPLFVKE